MRGLLDDVHYSLRPRRNPEVSLFAILILGPGIAPTPAMFSVICALLLEPPAYRDAVHIVLFSKSVTPVEGYAAVAILTGFVAAVACYIPARRPNKSNPWRPSQASEK